MHPTFYEMYQTLYSHYGPQHWWPAENVFEMMIGAILVQNTNWRNVDKALEQLKPNLTPEQMDSLSLDELAELIRPSGFYNVKAKRIKSFLSWLKTYDYQIERLRDLNPQQLREQLLMINGIGKETADSILLYAFDLPIFIVDNYARRLFFRFGYDMPKDYELFRKIVEQALPDNSYIYNEFHALIVIHSKMHCRAKPICRTCPLVKTCKQRKLESNR